MSKPPTSHRFDRMLRRAVADGRDTLERQLSHPSVEDRRIAWMRLLGACALGLFSAGFAILAVVVVLNLVFHFIPGN